jgi:dihydrofolate reductase
MAKLTYSAICSLDGFLTDAEGRFEWAAPSEEVHAFVNARERAAGTYLYGRAMYETMAAWETMDTSSQPEVMREYAQIWRAAEKIVFSRTLPAVHTARTRLERELDPAAIRALKAGAERDLTVGGAGLAAEALRAGLLDEISLFLVPVLVGAGRPALSAGTREELALLEHRRFDSGTVFVRYGVSR